MPAELSLSNHSPKTRNGFSLYCASLSLVLVAYAAYRAWALPLFVDEAITYNQYLTQSWAKIFNPVHFDANHHFLFTYLAKISVSLFGNSEIAIRLPTLFGSLLFLWSCYRIVHWSMGPTLFAALTFTVLTLNPLILDFLSAARGYGLALAFSFCGFSKLLPLLSSETGARQSPRATAVCLLISGSSLALSTAASLTFAFINFSMALIFGLFFIASRQKLEKPAGIGNTIVALAAWFYVPALLLFGMLTYLPLSGARPEDFYAGNQFFIESLHNLVGMSIRHDDYTGWEFIERSKTIETVHFVMTRFIWTLVVIVGGVMLGKFGGDSLTGRHKQLFSRKFDLSLWFSVTVFGVMMLLVVSLNITRDVLFPIDRTGLYLIAYLSLLLCLMTVWICSSLKPNLRSLGHALLLAWSIIYIFQFNGGPLGPWPYDASTRELMFRLNDDLASKPIDERRFGIDWLLAPSATYYYVRESMDWNGTFESVKPELQPTLEPYDYYLLRDEQTAVQHGLPVLLKGSNSAAVVATSKELAN